MRSSRACNSSTPERRGYYSYEGRTPVPDPELTRICEQLAAGCGVGRRADIGQAEIIERLLYPLINEGASILEEGIAYRPGDIDVVWVAGYGFPHHRGGPMFMADAIGLPVIVERLAHYASTRGNAQGYWTASPLLCRPGGVRPAPERPEASLKPAPPLHSQRSPSTMREAVVVSTARTPIGRA
jgi:hypothetical protein